MFTLADMQYHLRQRPFIPFRLRMSGGERVDVPTPELVLPGRRYAIIGLLDPGATDTTFDRTVRVWYMHVTSVEELSPGPLPDTQPPPPAPSDSPVPTP